jgi:carboxylesterase
MAREEQGQVVMDRSIRMQAGRTGVLLIHGLGGTPLELKSVAHGLHRAGFTVLVCQLKGHCGSEADLAATTWMDWHASVEAAYRELEARCATVFVGGLSMGALLALRLAQSPGTRVRGLLLFAPTLYYDGWAVRNQRWLMKWLGPLISTPIGRRYRFVEREPYGVKDERMRAIIRAALSSGDSSRAGVEGTPAVSLRELWRLAAAVRHRLSEISAPALIIHPREDDVSSLRNVHDLQAGLGGLVETLVLNDSYHLITLDRQRGLVVERTVDFVRRRDASVVRAPKLREVHTT